MRVFYVFEIRNELLSKYKKNPEELYSMLESIYLLNNDDIVIGYDMWNRIALPIDKDNFNYVLKTVNSDNLNYMTYNYIHIINDFYSDESTKLTLGTSHIKIKSNKSFPSFLRDIEYKKNLFVCDFINSDYFFLKEMFASTKQI